jgi:hypothetical protein
MAKPFVVILLILLCGCSNEKRGADQQTVPIKITQHVLSPDSVYSTDYSFIGDSILPGLKDAVRFHITKNSGNDCKNFVFEKKYLKQTLEPAVVLGNIRKGVNTSVFNLLPIAVCDSSLFTGYKDYYFTDTVLPKFPATEGCTHPHDIFRVGDIDEDGVSEIGHYYSSCVSHYKSLHVWTLRKNTWVEVGVSTFDQRFMSYDRPFSSYVRKRGKGVFEMYEKTDLPKDPTKPRIGYWISYKM